MLLVSLNHNLLKMPVHTIPEIFIDKSQPLPDLFVYDYRMTEDIVKNKANLSVNMFSFLQTGQKEIHFSNATVAVNEKQSILIKQGNCLFTELLNKDRVYYCKLFFFSQQILEALISKHKSVFQHSKKQPKTIPAFFVIENDEYINRFIDSLSAVSKINVEINTALLSVKFEEILLYLAGKYGSSFTQYISGLVTADSTSMLKKTVENNVGTALKIEEVAFLCNMSLSTFKRCFIKEFNENPGKWFQKKRLQKARELLEAGSHTASQIYQELGYNNLSNFSIAFKNEFGINPRDIAVL
jgi:AraC family transcriptional regulator, exoenzyme S synthesis regulatory protein ExsA